MNLNVTFSANVGRRAARHPRQNTTVFFFPTGETIFNNLQNRRARPWKLYKEQLDNVIKLLRDNKDFLALPEVDQNHLVCSISPDNLSWRQKAGCSCGCSPGFVSNIATRFTVYVDISDELEVHAENTKEWFAEECAF